MRHLSWIGADNFWVYEERYRSWTWMDGWGGSSLLQNGGFHEERAEQEEKIKSGRMIGRIGRTRWIFESQHRQDSIININQTTQQFMLARVVWKCSRMFDDNLGELWLIYSSPTIGGARPPQSGFPGHDDPPCPRSPMNVRSDPSVWCGLFLVGYA